MRTETRIHSLEGGQSVTPNPPQLPHPHPKTLSRFEGMGVSMSANETRKGETKAERVALTLAAMAVAIRRLNDAAAAYNESREAFYQAMGIPRWVTPVTDLGPVGARDTSKEAGE